METANLARSPRSIKGTSAKQLERKFRQLQLNRSRNFRVINIYFDGKDHVAWYYDDEITIETGDLNERITE